MNNLGRVNWGDVFNGCGGRGLAALLLASSACSAEQIDSGPVEGASAVAGQGGTATGGTGGTSSAGTSSAGTSSGGSVGGGGNAGLGGSTSPTGGSGGASNAGGGATNIAGMTGAGGTANPGGELPVLPADGSGFTALWNTKPYSFGPWFTYTFHAGTSIVPEGAVATMAGKMCATLAGTAMAAGGGAIGFKVCSAPKYPNADGLSSFFPLACPAANCVESEVAKPYSFCGGAIAGVTFAGKAIAKVAFLDEADKLIMEVNPPTPTAGFVAAPAGSGANIAAIHFKSFSDGEFCLSAAALKLQ